MSVIEKNLEVVQGNDNESIFYQEKTFMMIGIAWALIVFVASIVFYLFPSLAPTAVEYPFVTLLSVTNYFI